MSFSVYLASLIGLAFLSVLGIIVLDVVRAVRLSIRCRQAIRATLARYRASHDTHRLCPKPLGSYAETRNAP